MGTLVAMLIYINNEVKTFKASLGSGAEFENILRCF